MSDRQVYDLLYGNVPTKGFPDQTLRIGVEFEVGGAYEDWGWVLERILWDKGSNCWKRQRICAARTLEKLIKVARSRLRKELEDEPRCEVCDNGRVVGHRRVADEVTKICMECMVAGLPRGASGE